MMQFCAIRHVQFIQRLWENTFKTSPNLFLKLSVLPLYIRVNAVNM